MVQVDFSLWRCMYFMFIVIEIKEKDINNSEPRVNFLNEELNWNIPKNL